MHIFQKQHAGGDRGASAVEFALVVPILLLVVIGIVNFGFVFAQQISLNNAARQGARYAVVDGRNCGAILVETTTNAATIGMSAAQVPTPSITNCGASTVKPCEGRPTGTNITVRMVRNAGWVVTAPPFNLLPAPTLTGIGIMRCEWS